MPADRRLAAPRPRSLHRNSRGPADARFTLHPLVRASTSLCPQAVNFFSFDMYHAALMALSGLDGNFERFAAGACAGRGGRGAWPWTGMRVRGWVRGGSGLCPVRCSVVACGYAVFLWAGPHVGDPHTRSSRQTCFWEPPTRVVSVGGSLAQPRRTPRGPPPHYRTQP